MLAFNGLAAADLILVPASAERMAVDGVADLINHVQRIMWNKFNLNHQELRARFQILRAFNILGGPMPFGLLADDVRRPVQPRFARSEGGRGDGAPTKTSPLARCQA